MNIPNRAVRHQASRASRCVGVSPDAIQAVATHRQTKHQAKALRNFTVFMERALKSRWKDPQSDSA
jgi:hypothetical protein